MPLSSSISDSLSTSESSLLSFGISKFLIQWSQYSVSAMLSGAQSSSLSAWCSSIGLIGQRVNTWVRPRGRSFAEKAGGTGDLSDNLNAATWSGWKFDQNDLTICSVSEMYSTAVICLFRDQDSFCVAHRFWPPCYISKKSWTLAILCNIVCFASRSISKWLSVFVVSNSGWSPANNLLLARSNCLTTTFSQMVRPVVFDCLQPIRYRPKQTLASTPTACGMTENMSHATLERLANCECVSFCCHYQSMISGIQNVLLISFGSEW